MKESSIQILMELTQGKPSEKKKALQQLKSPILGCEVVKGFVLPSMDIMAYYSNPSNSELVPKDEFLANGGRIAFSWKGKNEE